MENVEFANTSDSSMTNSKRQARSNLESSLQNSKQNSTDAPEKAGIENREPKLKFMDYLLSQLQSQLGEINDRKGEGPGVGVRMFQRDDGLAILLGGVALCPLHHIMHAGDCPLPHSEEVKASSLSLD